MYRKPFVSLLPPAVSAGEPLRHSGLKIEEVRRAVAAMVNEDIVHLNRLEVSGRFNDAVLTVGTSGRRWVVRISPAPERLPMLTFERTMLAREALLDQRCAGLIDGLPPLTDFDAGTAFLGRAMLVRPEFPGLNGEQAIGLRPWLADLVWAQLKAIDHQLPQLPFVGFIDRPSTGWSAFLGELADGLMRDVVRLGVPVPGDITRVIGRYCDELDARPLRLCHGDLWPKNVLVHEPDAPGAPALRVLDWERHFVGDPASQWLIFEGRRYTMLSIDSVAAESTGVVETTTTAPHAVQVIYLSIVGLQMLAESVRNPVDCDLARRLIERATST